MIRIDCRVELRLMTLKAVVITKLVVSTDVTGTAWWRGVSTLQWKCGSVMIERRGTPPVLRVTIEAIVAHIPLRVVRIRRLVERGFMTLPAVLILERIVSIYMTLLAHKWRMSTCQWKARCCVLEGRWPPR